jgi:hypothetical protein
MSYRETEHLREAATFEMPRDHSRAANRKVGIVPL